MGKENQNVEREWKTAVRDRARSIRPAEIMAENDDGNAAVRPSFRFHCPALDRGGQGHFAKPAHKKSIFFSVSGDLCKQMSRKSNEVLSWWAGRKRSRAISGRIYSELLYGVGLQRAITVPKNAPEDQTLSSRTVFLNSLRLELAYFTGVPWLRRRGAGGAGTIVRYERVRPRRPSPFSRCFRMKSPRVFSIEPFERLSAGSMTSYRWTRFAEERSRLPEPKRFVCLTFDGAYRDLMICLSGAGEAWRSLLFTCQQRSPTV